MTKRSLVSAIMSVVCLLVFAGSCFAVTSKTFSVVVLTKEKTVFVGDSEILGVLDFTHKVIKDKTMTSSSEGVFVSYKGNSIEGVIKLKAKSAVLDSALMTKKFVTIKYIHSKDKKITETFFTKATIEKVALKKKGEKITEAAYSFQASSLVENKR